jgi:hypothetical protein
MFSFFLRTSFPTKPDDSLFLTLSEPETGKDDDDDNRCENVRLFVVKLFFAITLLRAITNDYIA